MRGLCGVVLAAVFALAVAQAARAAEPAKEAKAKAWPALVLTDESKLQVVVVPAGRRIEIRLPSNITTGYSWVIGELTPGPIKPLGKVQYVPGKKAEGRLGVGGTSVLALVATEPGKANLRLEYRRPWEKDRAPSGRSPLPSTSSPIRRPTAPGNSRRACPRSSWSCSTGAIRTSPSTPSSSRRPNSRRSTRRSPGPPG